MLVDTTGKQIQLLSILERQAQLTMAPLRTVFALLLSLGVASAFAPVKNAARAQTRLVVAFAVVWIGFCGGWMDAGGELAFGPY